MFFPRYLPEDIGVWKIEKAPERFHSRLNAVRKTYRYQIEMGPKKDVFQRGYYYGLGLELDVKAMEQAADLLTGTRRIRIPIIFHTFFCSCSNMFLFSVHLLAPLYHPVQRMDSFFNISFFSSFT